AVTQGVVDHRAERQPIDIADHGRRRATAAGRDLYATEQAIAVVAVVDLGAIGREHAAQAVGERVAVDRDIRMTGRHLLLLADVAMPTVTVDGGYATFHDPGQSPDGPGTRAPRHRIGLVVVIADIERAVGIAGAGQAIVGIVGRTADDTLGVGIGEAIAGGIVGIRAGTGIRALQLCAIAQAIVAVGGVEAGRIGHLRLAIQRIQLDRRGAVLGRRIGAVVVGDRAGEPVERVKALIALIAQSVDAVHEIAVGIVAIAVAGAEDRVIEPIFDGGELTQSIEST